ncbi:MFS transporter [Thermococcus aggregans]|uniref:MFS transporter n=1 Tax=Thermococcus aggregans TaxID=110163 RepID=A0A9E7SP58_THEAG|nr:MFS transporter [Thermococcus aggregans]USS40960.1 MFS transporter [Thermococcus aggregans]
MRKQTLGIALLIASAFTGTIGFRLATPAVAFYTRDVLNASMISISLISIAFVLSRAFSSVIGGSLLEKKKELVFLGALAMFGNAFVMPLYALTNSWVQVVGIKLLNGVFNGLSWPIAQFVIVVSSPKELKGRVTALYFLFGNFAAFLGNYTYALTIGLGIKAQMLLASLSFVVTSLLMLTAYYALYEWIVPKRTQKTSGSFDAKKILALSGLFFFTIAFSSGDITYVYVAEALGIEKGSAATLIGLSSLIGALLAYAPSWLADIGKEERVLRFAVILAALSPILAAIKTPYTVFPALVMALFAIHTFRPLVRKLLAIKASRVSASIGGLNAVSNLGTTLGQLLFGFAYGILGDVKIGEISVRLSLLIFAPFSVLLILLEKKKD